MPTWAAVVWVIVVAAAVAVLLAIGAEPRTAWMLPVVAVAWLGLDSYPRMSQRARGAYLAILVSACVVYGVFVGQTVAWNLEAMTEWDFLGFWLHGRTAVLGHNFYDPASAQALVQAVRPDVTEEFRREIVDAGFWYPPPTMFLFVPLGWFDPATALRVWFVLQGVVVLGVIALLARMFAPARGAVGVLVCAALVATNYGTELTAFYAQTNFVALLALLLFWRSRDRAAGGVWLTVACFVKPLLAPIVLLPLLAGRWRVLLAALATIVALAVASVLAFGPTTCLAYFAHDPIAAKPDWIYSQVTNQSLLGLILRATGATCSGLQCMTNPWFLAGAAALGVVTLVLGFRLQRSGEHEWALALYVLLALIVYPVSQLFYTVLLIPPALLVWSRRDRVPGGAGSTAFLLATIWALTSLADGERSVFAYLLMWGTVVWLGVGLIRSGASRVAASVGAAA